MEVPESGNKINKGIQARKFRAYLKISIFRQMVIKMVNLLLSILN